MLRSLVRFSLFLALTVAAGAQQKPATPHANAAPVAPKAAEARRIPSEETVNAFMQQMFGYQPSLTWKVGEIKPSQAEGLTEVSVIISSTQGPPQNSKLYITADGEHAVIGDIIPFGEHPFTRTNQELAKGMNGPSRGPADAPVTLVEFSDLQCPHCKEAQPTIDKLMAEEKGGRLVFQSFPLPMHDWAAKAAAYGECVAAKSNEAFWKFIQATYNSQTEITAANADEKLTALAEKAGVNGAEAATCSAKAETTGRVEHSVALGKSVGVTGTPALFINGRRIGNPSGIPYEALKSLFEFAAKPGS
jgi:protein-disulfide isomerase